MGRTIDSVQQLNKVCEEMLNTSEEMNFIDVGISANILRECVKEMNKIFDSNPEDTTELNKRKKEVERNAINLEYYMYLRGCRKFEDAYVLRNFLVTFYNDVYELYTVVSQQYIQVDSSEIIELATSLTMALGLFMRSKKLLVYVSDYETVEIQKITRIMDNFKDKNPEVFREVR